MPQGRDDEERLTAACRPEWLASQEATAPSNSMQCTIDVRLGSNLTVTRVCVRQKGTESGRGYARRVPT
jgi:hypothetical protein